MKEQTIEYNEFLEMCHVKDNTLRGKIKKGEIPGASVKDGKIIVLKGTRYPAKGIYKIDTYEQKMYVLLKAIDSYKYIDHRKLRLYEEQFCDMLKLLEKEKLIKRNGLCNSYGANGYDMTSKGSEIIKQRREKVLLFLAEFGGTFLGAFAKTLNDK